MQLKSVKIEKFKKIDNIELPISDLNILVGSNGCGKSSILQALHLTSCLMRQADRIRSNGTSMVRVSDLDYLPSDEYWRLGHGADWGNRADSPSSKVSFQFEDGSGSTEVAYMEIRSARNAGISVRGELPEVIRSQFRGDETFFSGFIPGISGIPNVEQKNSKRVVLKACSFGDSNVYLRNALNLLSAEDLLMIEEWLLPLLGPIRLQVNFDEANDFEINAQAVVGGITTPLELLGTGYLQLIQLFCYILLFKPKILLVDEPDIHLHPEVQEKLAQILLQIARMHGIKIVMTTHSPFIVRGAPTDTNVIWLAEGQMKSDDRTVVELALGWGAFGKKVIVVSEDAKNHLLKKLIRQWPEVDRLVTVLPGRGYSHLLTKGEAMEMKASLGEKFRILVHRDRDSLTDEEAENLIADYQADGLKLWLTNESDLEAEFCNPSYLSSLTGQDILICENWIAEILQQHSATIDDQFAKQRSTHNAELYKAGGSPQNPVVWSSFQTRPLKGAKGKFVFNQLKNKVPAGAFSDSAIENFNAHAELASSLKDAIQELLT